MKTLKHYKWIKHRRKTSPGSGETSRSWESFKNSAPDISDHGISGGFRGFIYYADTVKFAQENKKKS